MSNTSMDGRAKDWEGWRLEVERAAIPPMAWVMRVDPPVARVVVGPLVRIAADAVFEGTWVGPGSLDAVPHATTVFGSGVFVEGDRLVIVPPSHMLEAVYMCSQGRSTLVSNSFAGLAQVAGLELDPSVDYPACFAQLGDGITRFEIPTRTATVTAVVFDGIAIGLDGAPLPYANPRETEFVSYADYRMRLITSLISAFANAPDYEPLASISSGYDSAAIATLAVAAGCRRAVTIAEGKPVRGSERLSDSGEAVARKLGLDVSVLSRLGYAAGDERVEADFLASGMSGEDVVFSGAEPLLRQAVLLTGYYGDGMWWLNRPKRPPLWRLDQAGQSHAEFRLRAGYIHVPLPWFGAHQAPSIAAISRSAEMQPWVIGIDNDRPIPRRMLEDAGISRGSFGDIKRSASATIHADGLKALSPTTRAAVEQFAQSHGGPPTFTGWPLRRVRRLAMRLAKLTGRRSLYARIEGPRRQYQRHQPALGNLLLRWALSVVQPRYSTARSALDAPPRSRDP